MLTPEQTKLRRKDNEIERLRQENEELKVKVQDMRKAFKGTVLELAELIPSFKQRTELRRMANEIEV